MKAGQKRQRQQELWESMDGPNPPGPGYRSNSDETIRRMRLFTLVLTTWTVAFVLSLFRYGLWFLP